MNFVESELIEIESCDSTQDIALQRLLNDSAQSLWLRSDTQNAGRGRQSKKWISPIGNLYLSGAFRISSEEKHLPWPLASLIAGQSLAQSLEDLGCWEMGMFLKWPNDLFFYSVSEKNASTYSKVGGILCEMKSSVLIAGFGLNLVSSPNKEELASYYEANSIQALTQKTLNPSVLAIKISHHFTNSLNEFRANPSSYTQKLISALSSKWMKHFFELRGVENESSRLAAPTRLLPDGQLEVRFVDDNSLKAVSSGEFCIEVNS